jgi:hypothetical protein
MKQCVLAMVAAASEMENGMSCWKAGKGPGRKFYPDFGQWVPRDEMLCFKLCAAFMWADEKWWFEDRRDIDWDSFMPAVKAWNLARTKACVSWLLMLDEAMSGWKPKNSKTGGMPNLTFEPRKPVDLGTMFRNSAECHTGIFVHIDPVMCPERQDLKKHATTPNHLPHGPGPIKAVSFDAPLTMSQENLVRLVTSCLLTSHLLSRLFLSIQQRF